MREVLGGLRQFGALTPSGVLSPEGPLVIVAASPSENRQAIVEGMSRLVATAAALGQTLGFGEVQQVFLSLERGIMAVSPLAPPRLTGMLAVVVPPETVAGLLSVRVERAAQTIGVALERSPVAAQIKPLSPSAAEPEPATPGELPPEAGGVVRRAASALDSFGELAARSLQVAQKRLVCYLPSGLGDWSVPSGSGVRAAALAAAVHHSVETCCARLVAGKANRLTVRAERGTMMWQQLPNGILLFVAGAGEVRPGLAQLQLDRVASALGAVRIE